MASSTPGGGQTNLGLAPNVAGLLCYVPCCIGFVFAIVAAIVEKQSRFVRFHAFQSLLLHGAIFVVRLRRRASSRRSRPRRARPRRPAAQPRADDRAAWACSPWTMLLMIKANSGEEFELPVIGPMARQWV